MQGEDTNLMRSSPLNGVRVIRLATVPYFLVSQLQRQAEQLAAAGMDVLLVSADGPELARLNLGKNLRHKVIPFARAIRPWRDFITLLSLVRLIIRERPQILHSTTPKAGLLSAIAGFLTRVPVRLHTFTGQPWVNLRGPLRWIARAADRLICRLDTRVYADSPSQRQLLISEGIVSADKIDVLGAGSLAGVDFQRFSRQRWSDEQRSSLRAQYGISQQSRVIVFIGRLTLEKGIYELIKAFRMLSDSGMDCQLLLVGPHDGECGGTNPRIWVKDELPDRVHLTGYTDCPEQYLAMADVMCLPSYREGFGTVVIEAAAMGVPTVGTAINGLCDAVQDNKTGLLVKPRNAEALFRGLREIFSQPGLLARLGSAAHVYASTNFCLNHISRKLMTEYEKRLTCGNEIQKRAKSILRD